MTVSFHGTVTDTATAALTFDSLEATNIYCSKSRRQSVRWAVRDRYFWLAARILVARPIRRVQL